MGSYCSIHNDTADETVMVYVGVNTKVLKPILWTVTGMAAFLSGGVAWGALPGVVSWTVAEYTLVVSVSALTTAAGGFVSATNWVLENVQSKLVADLSKGGYQKLLPGQTYTTSKVSLALNMRAWIVRIQKTPDAILIRRCHASVWSGRSHGSNNTYCVMDKTVFSKWRDESIPVRVQMPTESTSNYDKEYEVLDSGLDCQCTEPLSSSWIHVDTTRKESHSKEKEKEDILDSDNDEFSSCQSTG